MSQSSNHWSALADQLSDDISHTEALLEILAREREGLEKRDYDAITESLAQKQPVLALLEQHAAERQQWLTAQQLENEAEWLALAKQQAPAVAEQWLKLEDLWQQCQESNQVNELITRRTQQVVGRLLDILQGTNSTPNTYNASGSDQHRGPGRTITSA